MKKILTLLLAAALFVCPMTACGDDGNSNANGTETGVQTPSGGDSSSSESGSSNPSSPSGSGSSNPSSPKTITGVTFSDKTVLYNGSEQELLIEGTLPNGVTVVYTNNKGTNAGTYAAKAVLSGNGYETLTLTATFTIRDLSDFAQTVLNAVLCKPDAWSFMPDGLTEEHMAYTALPVNDFTSNVQVSAMGKRMIGKQLNVLYDTLDNTETVLSAVNGVYAAGQTIANVYQTYINDHPDHYSQFTGSAGGFSVKITLNGNAYTLLAGNSNLSAELKTDGNGNTYGRIQLTDGAVLKYEAGEHTLKLALKITVKDISYLRQLEFSRSGQATAGYLYEYTGTDSTALKTSAVITIDENVTRVMSNKRESDDLSLLGYEEVYNSHTGEMIGGEVTETVSVSLVNKDYDTLWFPLCKVTNFDSVRVVANQKNGLNKDTVYLNGSGTAFDMTNDVLPPARKFDVEMRDIWYIVKQTESGGEITYSKEKCSIPMLFVQTKYFDDFTDDAVEKNGDIFSAAKKPVINQAAKSTTTAQFETLYNLFTTVKENVSYESVIAYIGTNNAFFG